MTEKEKFELWMSQAYPTTSMTPYISNTGIMTTGWQYNNPTLDRMREAWIAARTMKPMESAPKDRPILAFCDHEADPWTEDGGKTLILYAAHCEGLYHAPTGFHIIEWGGGWADSEEDGGGWMPDWWFVAGSEFEQAANPIFWMDLPEDPRNG